MPHNGAHASQSNYGGLQGAGNRDYCAVATQVSPSGIRAGLAGGSQGARK